jgi:cytochrome c oxidase subunit 3
MSTTVHPPSRAPVANAQIALYGILATVTMLFAAFASAYMVRQGSSDWQRVALPGILWGNTLVLAASSVTIELARRRQRATPWLVASNLLAFAFLAGQLLAWRQLAATGVYLPTNPHGSFFYIMTGLHGAHLLGGIVLLAIAWVTRRVTTMSCAATYWHFLGLVWLGVLVLVKFA